MTPSLALLRRAGALAVASLLSLATALPAAAAGTLDKVRDSGTLTLGYRADTRPFSYQDGGTAAGFSVALCQRIAAAVKDELRLAELKVELVPVTAAERFDALQQGRIDLLCGTATPTIERRASVDFSIPIFAAGIGAVMRADAERRLRDALADRPEPARPLWRAAPGLFTENVVFAVVAGTTIEKSLIDALRRQRIVVTVASVPDYTAGLRMVTEGGAAALFGDRPVLLDAARRSGGGLIVVDRSFSQEMLALALRRDDDAFRLLVDRTLSRFFRSPDLAPLYTQHFGPPDERALAFFQLVALPD